jgi:tetratricopeptide (TPR) repeat protein
MGMVSVRLSAALSAAVLVAGCASTSRPSLATHFVRQGVPTVDMGGELLRTPAGKAPKRPKGDYAVRYGVARSGGTVGALEASDPALRDALFAVRMIPSAPAHLAAAQAYRRLGVKDQAFDHLQQALVLDPAHASAYDLSARIWRDWGMPDLALPDAHRAVHFAPTSGAARNTLGTILFKLGYRKQAEQAFQEALAAEPNAWYAAQNLCDVIMRDGRTLEAIAACRHAESLTRAAPKAKPEPGRGPGAPR